jgi:hypothetical protein
VLDKPPRLSLLDYLFYAEDERFGALGISVSDQIYLPHRLGPLPDLGDVSAIAALVHSILAGEPVAPEQRRLIAPGVTLGGARPKALIHLEGAGQRQAKALVEDAALNAGDGGLEDVGAGRAKLGQANARLALDHFGDDRQLVLCARQHGPARHLVQQLQHISCFQPAHGIGRGGGLRRLAGLEQRDGAGAFAANAAEQSKIILARDVQGLGDMTHAAHPKQASS